MSACQQEKLAKTTLGNELLLGTGVSCRYEEGSAVRYNDYADQIMEGSNKQDSLARASVIEAFLIHEELLFLEEITNAGCYQSKDLLLAIALISALSPRARAAANPFAVTIR